jgi:peptidoglycan/LPS O-acetylase OafA/YrhL
MTVRCLPLTCLHDSNSNTAEYGIHFFFGAFLCDLSQFQPHISWIAARKWPGLVLAPILMLIGLLLASYPETNPQWMPWSNFMLEMAGWIFPPNHPDTPRFYTGIGLTFLALGIHFSSLAKVVLSNKYLLWAGKNSFAVYLLHGTLMRTILVWLLYGIMVPSDITQEDGTVVAAPHLEIRGRLRWYFWLPIWFVIMYWIAHLWTTYVDTFCARVTQNLEKYILEEEEEKSILPQ